MENLLIEALALLASYGYIVVFVWMFADQAALPLPSIPLLITSGALAATGDMSLGPLIAVAAAATLLADTLWYGLGRFYGAGAVGMVCRLALEPDSCVSTTRNAFGKFGPLTLVIAKYLPGVQTLAPASAGLVGAPFLGFLVLDILGTALFVLPFVLGGYFFQPQLVAGMAILSEVAGGFGWLLASILAAYGAVKAVQWLTFLQQHRLRRLTCEEVVERLDSDDPVTVIDLRQKLDFEIEPRMIPGALRIPINEMRVRRSEIPTRYDVVLVCT